MTELSQNPNWPLIANLQPQLRKHVSLHPQVFRGESWYVLRDQSNGRHLRFTAPAYEFIGRLNGKFNVEQAWIKAQAAAGEDGLSQDEVIVILTQLFSLDVLRSGLPTEAKDFFERFRHERRIRRENAIMNPLAIRIPLLDPDNFLNLFVPWVRPLFSKTGLAIWAGVVGFAALLALANFPALSASVDKDILSAGNIVSMLLVFIVIKTIHEFAHAFAVKTWGGNVHEMGITILILAPIPYVDASAAWGFRDKHKRMLVGAIGIIVELFLASLALFVWIIVEPGFIQDVAFNALLIASVSTLLFNGNPLLRFDGYYVLQDLIEVPNLSTRASRYYLYLIQHYLFDIDSVHSPASADGETAWFAVYGLSAFFYRLFILAVIVLFLAEQYLFMGVALGVWAVTMQIILPLIRGGRFLASSPKLAENRPKAILVSAISFGAISLVLLLMPVPNNTNAQGVVWVPDQAQLYAGSDGFISDVLVPPGSQVKAGTPVVQMYSLGLKTSILKLEAKKRELEIRSSEEYINDPIKFDILKEELIQVEAELTLLKERESGLLVRSKVNGTFILPEEWKFKGSYLEKGKLIGYVVNPEHLIVRTVVDQSDIGQVRTKVKQVEVRLAEKLGKTLKVEIERSTPAGITTLPSRALGAAGGGQIAIRMSDESGLTAKEKVFQIDLKLPENIAIAGVGERAYVQFDHGYSTLASQWFQSARQLLLSRLKF